MNRFHEDQHRAAARAERLDDVARRQGAVADVQILLAQVVVGLPLVGADTFLELGQGFVEPVQERLVDAARLG